MLTQVEHAIRLIDLENSEDPNLEIYHGKQYPKELLYSMRMTERLEKYAPDASDAVKFAARCQHIRRWEIPRDRFPMDKQGSSQWKNILNRFHADLAEGILTEVGYNQEMVNRVRALLLKENLKTDPEMQILEDVTCLVFLEFYLHDFAEERLNEKVAEILEKTWSKMSERARQEATRLPLTPTSRTHILKALFGKVAV